MNQNKPNTHSNAREALGCVPLLARITINLKIVKIIVKKKKKRQNNNIEIKNKRKECDV